MEHTPSWCRKCSISERTTGSPLCSKKPKENKTSAILQDQRPSEWELLIPQLLLQENKNHKAVFLSPGVHILIGSKPLGTKKIQEYTWDNQDNKNQNVLQLWTHKCVLRITWYNNFTTRIAFSALILQNTFCLHCLLDCSTGRCSHLNYHTTLSWIPVVSQKQANSTASTEQFQPSAIFLQPAMYFQLGKIYHRIWS